MNTLVVIFFETWDKKEWQLFHQFIVVCVQDFLQNGLQRIEYSKEEDNFRSFFSNDVALHQFEIVFEKMRAKGNFSVMEFLAEYKKEVTKIGERVFHIINLKEHVIAYIDYHELNIKYVKSKRRWYFEE